MFIASAYDAAIRILYLRFRSRDVYRYFELSEEQTGSFSMPNLAVPLRQSHPGPVPLRTPRRLAKLHAA
jgi:hypothetical protein